MKDAAANETSLSPSLAQQVDPVCDRFEAAWKTGQRPRVEDYLADTPAAQWNAVLRELLLIEFHHRRSLGESPHPEDYRGRFPALDPAWLERRLTGRLAAPEAPALIDAAALVAVLRAGPLLESAQRDELPALQTAFPNARALAGELLRRDWLTAYQVNQLLQGRGAQLVLGQYLLLERLGEGGMGQVFKARHQVMKRVVALKVIHKEFLAHTQAVERFQREIEMAAQLSHANIVIAHDAGRAGEQHYFAMEYVAGTDLASLLEQRGPLAVAVACDYVRQAALGLQHAHERGLVHRDIKPANLLLNDKGVIKVMDLGLARLRPDPAGKPSRVLTQLGTVMGTADYIAPEQAVDSSRVDARADVYSLGCTLYHLVTGQPPFPKGSFGQKLKWHQQKEPPAVEQLRADVPPVLAAAVRKLMAKRPEDRYQTAAEVVTALTEVLAVMHGAPVARVVAADPPSGAVSVVPTQVKPAGPGPKPPSTSWLVRTQAKAADSLALLGQKARKRRLFLSAAGIVLVLGLLTWLVLAITGRNPQPQPTSGENLPEQPGAKKASPLDQLKRAKIPAYELAMAERWAPKKSLPQLVAILGDSRLKHWAAVTAVTFSPNGKVLASASQDFSVKLWDPGSGEELRTLLGHTGGVTSLAFSPDGKQLASGSQDGSVRLSDPATGKELRTLKGHKARIAAVAFSANGKLLASAGDDKTLRVWATESGQQLFEIRGAFRSVAFSPDGETLVTGGYDRKVQWWEAGTGKERPIRASAEHGEVIHSVAFSPDGKLVASGSDDQMVIWDAATGKELHKQKSRVACVVFSKDSKTLATVSMNGEVRLWDTELGKPLPKWPRYPDGLQTVAFSPDGKTVASGGFAGMVYLWDVEQNKELFDLPGHRGSVMSLAFDPVAFQTLISGGWDRNLRQWDSATGKELRSRAGEAKAVWPLAISPDGKVLAAGSRDHHVSLWEAPPLEKRRTLRTPEQHSVSAVALYAEGKKLATGGGSVADMNVRLWDLDTSQELKLLEGHKATITSLVATADGKILASASEDGSVRLWDLTAGKAGPVLTPQKKAAVQAVTFSRNGQFLASGDAEGVVRLWQVTMGKEGIKGKEMGQLAKHAQAVGSVAFSPDGQLLASAAKDGTVRLTWVAKPGTKDIVFNLAPPGAPINQVAFDEPGRHLVTANGNGTLYILRVR